MTKRAYTLRSKLLFLAGQGIASALLVGAIGWFGLRAIGSAETTLAEDAVPSMVLIAKINDTMNTMREKALLALIANGEAERSAARRAVAAGREALPKLVDDYKSRVDADEERQLFERLGEGTRAFVAQLDGSLREAEGADAAKLEALRQTAAGAASRQFDAVGDTIDALIDFNAKAVAATHGQAQQADRRAITVLAATIAAVALVMAVFAVTLTRAILRQLGGEPDYATEVVREIAAGNLGVAVHTRVGDESSLLAAMAAMRANLERLVGQVRASSDSIATGSNEIASGNADLSRRTEQQASNLQQTAASMEELTATVNTNAETARQAAQLAGGARDVALQGGEVVEQVVQTMGAISASSQKIADIIGTIDGIAFQTNILALNAAVEAARAGEQGRGFAVVAGEVRNLAQRAAAAAREIKQLITDSVEKVDAGRTQVGAAGRTMSDIVEQVKRVSDLIGEIDAATREQAQGIGEVGGAVTQLDQATQQNAALVEQSAAAADSLNQQAGKLVEAVSVFRLSAA